ncbi:aminoglycoside phosphotransferase family protein [Humibacillus xanthopallidus]|uniref:Aminoglycoside phosphotransferase (APT) family kinase protein n=1 Tax=Humibacillus xanthopallidus TaxID=412689 RepID=A0A543HG98_9MICO|nr:aminoglycoside phosphotransferase family protein [Humibacillus xanthopallidus]TQM57364.1 aminoglycoside phosphotransferase (APT) family kinase protein [Humibacillus xanthopallidus]
MPMREQPMHANQIEVTAETATRLVREQFPRWADLPVCEVTSHGTVNAIFRVGTDLVARLPLEGGDLEARRIELLHEMDAARRLLSVSPVAAPEPVALGEPGAGYPLPWSVYRWVPGSVADDTDVADSRRFAAQLAGFVAAVRSLPTEGRTFRGSRRGGRLTQHDDYVRRGLHRSTGLIDTVGLAALWEQLRSTPRTCADTWTHGDLMPGNLLVRDGGLTGVIDVGQLAVADPALDLQPAWNLFTPRARAAFRDALACEDAEWDRGKGWAFAQAIGCLWYYRETNPVMSRTAHRTLQALLDAG